MDPEFAAALAAEPFAPLPKGLPEGMSLPEYIRQTRMMVGVLDEFYGQKLSELGGGSFKTVDATPVIVLMFCVRMAIRGHWHGRQSPPNYCG